ncbi:hypothetical protein [Desulfosediminicola flagellatus]|uniref:hypothetical protein n=1 Tax=Desulfosediminicola flagellatus TaxID=2569541 RepID=UPI0012946EA3|nr:hypothetical protein [Desulfosediminicola flagellatus]
MNKKWKKPELIVITRTSPDESVLKACSGVRVNAANIKDSGCNIGVCDPCESVGVC